MKKISDATFYLSFSIILALFLVYFVYTFRTEVDKQISYLSVSKCNELYYNNTLWPTNITRNKETVEPINFSFLTEIRET